MHFSFWSLNFRKGEKILLLQCKSWTPMAWRHHPPRRILWDLLAAFYDVIKDTFILIRTGPWTPSEYLWRHHSPQRPRPPSKTPKINQKTGFRIKSQNPIGGQKSETKFRKPIRNQSFPFLLPLPVSLSAFEPLAIWIFMGTWKRILTCVYTKIPKTNRRQEFWDKIPKINQSDPCHPSPSFLGTWNIPSLSIYVSMGTYSDSRTHQIAKTIQRSGCSKLNLENQSEAALGPSPSPFLPPYPSSNRP